MKKLSTLWIILVLVSCGTTLVFADDLPFDPNIALSPGTGLGNGPTITSDSFTFIDNSNSPMVFLQGANHTWSNLLITTDQNPAGQLSSYNCTPSDYFTDCSVTLTGNMVSFFYSGLDLTHQGIPDGGTKFRIQANSFQASGSQCLTGGTFDPNRCWDANSTFNVTANVPEPSTLILLAMGLIGAGIFRRR